MLCAFAGRSKSKHLALFQCSAFLFLDTYLFSFLFQHSSRPTIFFCKSKSLVSRTTRFCCCWGHPRFFPSLSRSYFYGTGERIPSPKRVADVFLRMFSRPMKMGAAAVCSTSSPSPLEIYTSTNALPPILGPRLHSMKLRCSKRSGLRGKPRGVR